MENSQSRVFLRNNINLFINHIKNDNWLKSDSAIQCIIVSGNENCKKAAKKLQEKGFDIRPILSPTVEKGKERLRICLHSFNNKEDIIFLCQLLNQL
jgi:8-amino-7-oxononanoate synthase